MKKLIPFLLLACTLPAAAQCSGADRTRLEASYQQAIMPNTDRPFQGMDFKSLQAMVTAAASCHDALLTGRPLTAYPHDVLEEMYKYAVIQAYGGWEVMQQFAEKLDKVTGDTDARQIWK